MKLIPFLNESFCTLALPMSSSFININGTITAAQEAHLSFDNRAFRYGYGLFETILFKDGAIELQAYHTERLFAGARQLGFQLPVYMNDAWFEAEIKATVKANSLERLSRVRLQLYASSGNLYGEAGAPEYMIECFPLEQSIIRLNMDGLDIGIAKGIGKSADSLSNIKSCNALIYIMAAQQARANNWHDTLILNTAGNIIESTIANIFIVKQGVIHTPPLAEGCVAGVMRRKLLNDLPQLGYGVEETPVTYELLHDAGEVFLTNAIRRIQWVASINNKIYTSQVINSIVKKLF